MTDRELLEAAAKAAGMADAVFTEDPRIGPSMYSDALYESVGSGYWNPLEHDGDALRLAVKLRIQVTPGTYNNEKFTAHSPAGAEACERPSYLQDDAAATRRVIVRAAAAQA